METSLISVMSVYSDVKLKLIADISYTRKYAAQLKYLGQCTSIITARGLDASLASLMETVQDIDPSMGIGFDAPSAESLVERVDASDPRTKVVLNTMTRSLAASGPDYATLLRQMATTFSEYLSTAAVAAIQLDTLIRGLSVSLSEEAIAEISSDTRLYVCSLKGLTFLSDPTALIDALATIGELDAVSYIRDQAYRTTVIGSLRDILSRLDNSVPMGYVEETDEVICDDGYVADMFVKHPLDMTLAQLHFDQKDAVNALIPRVSALAAQITALAKKAPELAESIIQARFAFVSEDLVDDESTGDVSVPGTVKSSTIDYVDDLSSDDASVSEQDLIMDCERIVRNYLTVATVLVDSALDTARQIVDITLAYQNS